MTSLNSDDSEIAKFSDLAHRWWDPESEFKPLHVINPLRLEWIDSRTELSGKRVLDIGCGGGILAESMARKGALVTGIDLSDKALAVARLHLLESALSVQYEKISAEDLAVQQAESFDVITCMEMLEHVPDPSSIVRACERLVKPDGYIFFSTLNRNLKSYLLAIIGAEYVLNMLPRGTHDYSKFIKPSELSGYMRKAGINPREIVGLTYNPFSKTYRLCSDTSTNYMVFSQK